MAVGDAVDEEVFGTDTALIPGVTVADQGGTLLGLTGDVPAGSVLNPSGQDAGAVDDGARLAHEYHAVLRHDRLHPVNPAADEEARPRGVGVHGGLEIVADVEDDVEVVRGRRRSLSTIVTVAVAGEPITYAGSATSVTTTVSSSSTVASSTGSIGTCTDACPAGITTGFGTAVV